MKLTVKPSRFTWHKYLAKASTVRRVSICALIVIIIATMSQVQNTQTARKLSLYLGHGICQWEAPIYDVPEDINFTKTLIAGYPSGDKRLTFVQMEALTGLSARDEWDFAFLVSSCMN